MNNINMYNSFPEFEGIRLKVDSFIAYKDQDSVMPIFFEEQPLTWLLFKKEITDLCHKTKAPNILDVGCGSGFWSILLKKKFPQANVYALDKNRRAIEYTILNSKNNCAKINIQEIAFEDAAYDIKFDIIILTPPYHLFPTNRNFKIPYFANGGDLGLSEFYNQLEIAFRLLSKEGVILFNQMSVGGDKPSYVDRINQISQGHADLHFINILQPIETAEFLDSLYPRNEFRYDSNEDIIILNPDMKFLYYTSGLIKNNSNGFLFSYSNYSEHCVDIKNYCEINQLNYRDPIWEDRIDLHREINSFTPNERLDITNSNINCNMAKDIKDATKAFHLSGCNVLAGEAKKILENDSFIIDFSTIVSIIDSNDNTLTDFITIINQNNDFWSEKEERDNIQKKLSVNYNNIYQPLKDRNLGVYYHPNFFYSPTTNGVHISMDPNTYNLDLNNMNCEITDYNFNEVSDNTWFSNVSFPLSYDEFINKTKEPVYSIKKRCHILHGLYSRSYNIKGKDSLLICIPLIGYPFYQNDKFNGLGAIFLYIVTNRLEKYTPEIIQKIANKLSIIGKDITYAYSFNIGKVLADNVTREAIKSAISAIMARNMSHNLGSHFISNTKNYFGQLADNENENDQRRRDYRGIKHTLQYIQERMDFIATIVSSDKFPYGPVNVKSQIFDELTPDEFGCRHEKETTNFLLDFLVYSEAISKCTNEEYSSNKVRLTLNLITKDDKTGKLYRFGAMLQGEDKEAREIFANRNLAVPGGVLGRHAIFTIIENVIRNSSKHDKKNIPGSGLNVSVRLNIVDNNTSNIVIFDNKGNAEKVKDNIFKLYQETQILDENGSIDKGNKGLKEILIATLWLNNVNLAEWLAKYDSLKNNYEDKFRMLGQYLEIITVDENGEETAEASHLGYKIKIKPFNSVQRINATENNFILYNDIADVNADIVTADKDYYVLTHEKEYITDKTPKLSFIFPRFVESKDVNDPVLLMKKSLVNRGLISEDTLNNISIDIVPRSQSIKSICKPAQYNIYNNDSGIVNPLAVKIIYKSHLSIDETEIKKTLDRYPNANYIDSISGGDFTHTLTEEFFLSDELNRLKIIESALCKIVIVDERVFNNYAHGQMPQDKSREVVEEVDRSKKVNEILDTIKDLKQGNIPLVKIVRQIKEKHGIQLSVRDILSEKVAGHILDVLQKPGQSNETEVKAGGDHEYYHKFLEKKGVYIYNILPVTGEIITADGRSVDLKSGKKIINSPTFFSIHLSLIEGLIKEHQILNPGEKRSSVVREIMDRLKICFGNPKFMMVHSGRGNLSKELEEELKDKAFMSLSAIEASLYDSKYFLSQLLCSNCYFGKGKINL